MDWVGFTVAAKGVLLEGLEVVFIVVTFGASAGMLGPAAIGAAAAGLLVLAIAAVVHRPLAAVPENGLKFTVGLMLVAFGTFWAGEGIGIEWPAGDAVIVLLLVGYLVLSLLGLYAVRERLRGRRPAVATSRSAT